MYESTADCLRKNSKRTWEVLIAVPIFYAFYIGHLFLPSYESARVITILNLNLVLAVVTLDLMLANMTAKSFMAYHPAFLLLAAPLIAHFLFKVSP